MVTRGWILAVFFFVLGSASWAQVTDERARQALDAGVKYLKSRQRADGNWPGYADYPAGMAGVCTLALINAGLPLDDPAVAKALSFLRAQTELERTYSVSLQTLALCAAEPGKDKFQISRNVGWLQKSQRKTGDRNGAWGYVQDGDQADNSNTQFALLALYEADMAGVPVTESTWRRALAYWQRQQKIDGSFSYGMTPGSTGSMTCAGISSLIIAAGQVSALDARITEQGVQCCGGAADEDEAAVQRALEWLGENFSVRRNPAPVREAGISRLYYYLYALERVGRLAGRRFIGGHDWYREGVGSLLELQDPVSGYWNGDEPIASTAFAVLFLSKGRRPVLLSKLKRPPADDWDRHRHSVAHLTRHVEQRWERDLTWQVIELEGATAEDLWQSPILFLSGRDGLQLSQDEKQALRDYVERGGFLFAENCCEGGAFDEDFRELMNDLFPDSPLRLLPPDHAVWYADQPVDADFLRPLYGIDACCRTGVVYSPEDLSCFWELAVPERGRGVDYPPATQREIEACLAIGANIVTYATGRELRQKLEAANLASIIEPNGIRDRATLMIAKLQHTGGSDDAPTALANALAVLGQETHLPVATEKRLLQPLDPTLPDYPIAFVHGRRAFRWSRAEREALRQFLANGGAIFADAICANAEFADSFRREMQSLFPELPWTIVPPEHPMFTPEFQGHDIRQVTLRDPRSRARLDDPLATRTETIAPLLEGFEIDGRYVVLFSPYDMSCALENRPSLECRGYGRIDAAKIATNIILYAMQQ